MITPTVAQLRKLADLRLELVADGDVLSELESCLIKVGIAAAVTSLNRAEIDSAIESAFAAGASSAQIQEIVTLVSGLGVHSLMAACTSIARIGADYGWDGEAELDEEQANLWDCYVGDDVYWTNFRAKIPGFLEALIRLSPNQFEAFFTYCKLPWAGRSVPARTKELVALACDATQAHRFGPGFLLHLENAISIGVGRLAIGAALDLARAAPAHDGYA
ncbi:MAG: hypothetical protein NVS3B5_09670 [Sphingomicrobium sp.]